MKLKTSDVTDRYDHFLKQDFDIQACCQDLIDKKPFGDVPFYIFVHARTDDDISRKRLIWQPRLTKPSAQSNSMLFKAYPGTDVVKMLWILPQRELWEQFKRGNLMENRFIVESILEFQKDKAKMEAPEPDDLADSQVRYIYEQARTASRNEQMFQNAFGKKSPVAV